MKKYVMAVVASLMLVSATAFAAVPSAGQIEQSMTQGNWSQADAQLNEVLQAHPNNAKAHYLYAQVLDREGRSSDALAQVQQARTLDPAIKFTDPSRFNAMEARIRSDANRVNSSANTSNTSNSTSTSVTRNPFNQGAVAASERHGPSMGMWALLAVLFVGIALVLRWGLKRARSNDDGQADADRRTQLKRATELLNDVRSLKLDVRLSTQPGHEAMLQEVEGIETQLRQMVEALSNSKNPVPPYAIEDLANQIDSVRARSEGRPDPRTTAAPASADGQSVYAQEAERFGRNPQGQPPYSPYPQQQPPVIVQQGGGFGGGMGGLLTGVLLGEAMSGGNRERVIEREVPVDDDELRRRRGNDDNNNGGGLDFGNGSNDWSDNGGGGVDVGSNDSGNWDNS
ncbi:tetratricopeptide repeat protein [Caballeronia sp. dw_19]|uniref:tetratricopeptide repeat protein n=1 Tax=Caballeronia sp. dw_19 TaxID=2719791 RepID=UPI001BD500CE|nr:tetratricopeptide repeat protein [Caballeronia sp. dw_19]